MRMTFTGVDRRSANVNTDKLHPAICDSAAFELGHSLQPKQDEIASGGLTFLSDHLVSFLLTRHYAGWFVKGKQAEERFVSNAINLSSLVVMACWQSPIVGTFICS